MNQSLFTLRDASFALGNTGLFLLVFATTLVIGASQRSNNRLIFALSMTLSAPADCLLLTAAMLQVKLGGQSAFSLLGLYILALAGGFWMFFFCAEKVCPAACEESASAEVDVSSVDDSTTTSN